MRDTLAIHHSLRDLVIISCVTCWCLVKQIQCRLDICMRSWREVKVFHKERRLSLFRLVNFKRCQGWKTSLLLSFCFGCNDVVILDGEPNGKGLLYSYLSVLHSF